MTRVSENSNTAALNLSMNRARAKLEDMNLKGSTLKNINRPSDDPASNVEALAIGSANKDNVQYIRNINYAGIQLSATEQAIEQITDIVNKAKEISLAQSSDIYNVEVRKNIANEVRQLYAQALAVGNKRVGNRYIFGGHATLIPPFTPEGKYVGDQGKIALEVAKDLFVPTNLHGREVFFVLPEASNSIDNPLHQMIAPKALQDAASTGTPALKEVEDSPPAAPEHGRNLASVQDGVPAPGSEAFEKQNNIFGLLETLTTALENNDSKTIQGLLEKFDGAVSRLITQRTRIGSVLNTIESAQQGIEVEKIQNAAMQSKLIDTDIAELFADITKQQEILKTTYKSGQGLLNQSLLDFLR